MNYKVEKTYDAEADIWHDDEGIMYVKNEFDPINLLWIDVSGDSWKTNYAGCLYCIEWNKLGLSTAFLAPFRVILRKKLKTNSASYMGKVDSMLRNMGMHIGPHRHSVGALDLPEWVGLWDDLPAGNRSFLREFYTDMVQFGLGGARRSIALGLKDWNARSDVKHLRVVLEWNETKGALLNAEAELVRQALLEPLPHSAVDSTHAGRILTWMIFETLKRGAALTRMTGDDLKEIIDDKTGITEWMLDIPMVKRQTGQGSQWWPITPELAHAIKEYEQRPSIAALRKRYKNLILWKTVDLERGGISPYSVTNAVKTYVKRLNIISPRTNERITLSPTRIRHTGATLLAKNGVSRDILQAILEHDSSLSANAYIDACGSELIPAIDRVDRKMNTFSELSEAFFKGTTGANIGESPIAIPVLIEGQLPALVGDCGKKSYCPKNPFFACYDGCADFIAWREADHTLALTFAETEQKRWAQAEGKDRVNAPKNFERVRKAIEEVIDIIKNETIQKGLST